MKGNRKELKARFKKSASDAIRKRLSKTEKKDVRKSSGDSDVRMSPDDQYISISKWLRGITFDRWDGADRELRLHKQHVGKALGADDPTRGGVFVPTQISNQVIERLREISKIRQLPGIRTMTVPGLATQMPAVDEGVAVTWGTENNSITEDTSFRTGSATMELKRCQGLYKASRELIEFGGPNADAVLRDDIANAVGVAEDKVVCEGTGLSLIHI